jgi:hypothetical protein
LEGLAGGELYQSLAGEVRVSRSADTTLAARAEFGGIHGSQTYLRAVTANEGVPIGHDSDEAEEGEGH